MTSQPSTNKSKGYLLADTAAQKLVTSQKTDNDINGYIPVKTTTQKPVASLQNTNQRKGYIPLEISAQKPVTSQEGTNTRRHRPGQARQQSVTPEESSSEYWKYHYLKDTEKPLRSHSLNRECSVGNKHSSLFGTERSDSKLSGNRSQSVQDSYQFFTPQSSTNRRKTENPNFTQDYRHHTVTSPLKPVTSSIYVRRPVYFTQNLVTSGYNKRRSNSSERSGSVLESKRESVTSPLLCHASASCTTPVESLVQGM